MPRLRPSLFWQARALSPQAPVLLPACRDIPSTLNELRWIKEHIQATPSPVPAFYRFWQLCEKRGKGVPLQYVLGSQPFGELDIRCRPGVLIPRPETEAYAAHLADRLVATLRRQSPPELSSQGLTVIDFCTGTGCIALDLYGRIRRAFPSMPLRVQGVDISPAAVTLARQNLARNIRLNHLPADGNSGSTTPSVQFSLGDIFSSGLTTRLLGSERRWDVMVSNPPYISRRGFALNTARSVRNWEPRTALVPKSGDGEGFVKRGCEPEDVFYARLLEIAALLKPKIMLFEVADMEQAIRVVQMAKSIRQGILEPGRSLDPSCVEIWKDTITSDTGTVRVGNYSVVVRGTGHGRSVYISMNSETLGST